MYGGTQQNIGNCQGRDDRPFSMPSIVNDDHVSMTIAGSAESRIEVDSHVTIAKNQSWSESDKSRSTT